MYELYEGGLTLHDFLRKTSRYRRDAEREEGMRADL